MFVMEEEKKQRKRLTPQQAMIKAQMTCAYQERCQQEMRDKLFDWGLHSEEVESIIADLISNNFLSEERYAKAFAGGKFRIKKWGRVKIRIELKKKKISDYCIRKAMEEIDDREYIKTLKELIEKKGKEIKGLKEYQRNYKIAQYAASRGFEQDLVFSLLKQEDY